MIFKDLILSLDIPDDIKETIINKHVEEERKITDLVELAARRHKEEVERIRQKNRECIEECRGALAAASAMLEGMSGTHMMKHYQAEATARWIRRVREELKEPRFNGNLELPF